MSARTKRLLLGWAVAGLLGLAAGCGRDGKPESLAAEKAIPAGPGERAFAVKGIVRDLPAAGGTIVVRHEEIPGYMPKMTMELTVLNTNELTGLKVGDAIEFRLVARQDDHFIDGIRRTGSVEGLVEAKSPQVEADPEDDEDPALEPGDPVPDLSFRLETGDEASLSKWRGSAVAMTFFFTRCPLPDFCPRMNKNFQEARDRLRQTSAGPTNWVFLSLSFDSDFDQPKVLQGHAPIYRGSDASGWWFAALGPSGVAAVKSAFDLMIGREAGGFSHNLRTVVVDPQGKLAHQFNGNRWTAEELAAAMVAAANQGRSTP